MDNKVRLQYFPIGLSMFLHSTQRSENDELSMLISNVRVNYLHSTWRLFVQKELNAN